MSAAMISRPGTEQGPCSNTCSHLDCIAARQMAIEICRICHQQIGYEQPFYAEPDSKVHKSCLEDELRKKLKTDVEQEPRFLTYEETATLLRVEVGTVRNWVSAEKIPFRKAGGNTLFLLDEILRWTIPPSRKQSEQPKKKSDPKSGGRTSLSAVK